MQIDWHSQGGLNVEEHWGGRWILGILQELQHQREAKATSRSVQQNVPYQRFNNKTAMTNQKTKEASAIRSFLSVIETPTCA